MRLQGKNALITGGGRGIGRAVAERFVREGAVVAIAARTAKELEETAQAIRKAGGRCLPVPCDLRVDRDAEKMVREVVEAFTTVHVLVNNAGVFGEPFGLDATSEAYDETMSVNVRAAWHVTKLVVTHMPPDGSIINVTSGLAHGPSAEYFPYSLSKWALEGLTFAQAARLLPRANAVDPGLVATRMTDFSGKRPEDVTEVFVYLASDESKGVRGQVLRASKFPRRT
jgi:NAD(P)-dependent dehydrogenase (short-subunit alcohol dehydrogenase family)